VRMKCPACSKHFSYCLHHGQETPANRCTCEAQP
jgi:hypothetical protein